MKTQDARPEDSFWLRVDLRTLDCRPNVTAAATAEPCYVVIIVPQ